MCDGHWTCGIGEEEGSNCESVCSQYDYENTLMFGCSDGDCIPRSKLCDGHAQCETGEDEGSCDTTTSDCVSFELECSDGSCIPTTLICDGQKDCPFGEDELACSSLQMIGIKRIHICYRTVIIIIEFFSRLPL